mmetsp:Transcript_26933/g.59152  ORF Transcript_26933/g.59152 Transcript_26933/m.59152 type:complete len:214 (+) Transcript_26933:791-1432(+)
MSVFVLQILQKANNPGQLGFQISKTACSCLYLFGHLRILPNRHQIINQGQAVECVDPRLGLVFKAGIDNHAASLDGSVHGVLLKKGNSVFDGGLVRKGFGHALKAEGGSPQCSRLADRAVVVIQFVFHKIVLVVKVSGLRFLVVNHVITAQCQGLGQQGFGQLLLRVVCVVEQRWWWWSISEIQLLVVRSDPVEKLVLFDAREFSFLLIVVIV